ncbi:MAG TPA: STAS domain-containing protein [Actinomycetes bacterium]|nr:STAS domain-containing protein [Actinomycetes bacterium]
MELEIDVREDQGLFIISAKGEIDVWTADALRQSLHDLQADGQPRVIVDLTEVPFVDSTGIGVLVGGLKRAREGGGSLHLVVSSAGVRKVLRITSLDQVFPVHDTLSDATAVARTLGATADVDR